jgi:hypothetical protein
MSETDSSTVQGGESETTAALGKGVDWLVTALLVLGGVLTVMLGFLLNAAADRAEIADLVADGTIQSTVLSDAELVDVTYALAWWGGVGFAAVGVVMILGGVGFVLYRRRARRRRAETGTTGPDTTTNAIIGAIVSVVTSFVPLSPVLGGLIAGYLQKGSRTEGARVGGLAGLVAAVPIALLFLSLVVGLFGASTEVGAGFEAGLVGVGFAIAAIVAALYLVVLSAVGGYFGVYLSERREQPGEEEQTPAA